MGTHPRRQGRVGEGWRMEDQEETGKTERTNQKIGTETMRTKQLEFKRGEISQPGQ